MSEREPDFINPEGFKWWRESSLSDYAREKLGDGWSVWLVEDPTRQVREYALLNHEGVADEARTLEEVAFKIDTRWLMERFV